MKKILILLICLPLLILTVKAQDKEEKDKDEKENKEILKEMISDRNFPGTGENAFGRFSAEMQSYRNQSPQQLAANWSYVDASGNLHGDVGRAASITFDTLNINRFYVCTPHSGVWLTNDNGATYTPITEALPTQATNCLVIDPSNTNTLYLGTGTYQMDMPRNSMGVFKSTDGGINWLPTALSFAPSDGNYVGELAINPLNTASVIAATSNGLYRTYNGGVSWSLILNDTVNSVRFKPGDTTVIYIGGPRFYRSVNSGNNFIPIVAGINDSFQWRYVNFVRTVAAYPNIVYFISSGGWANPSFYPALYIHKSIDGGNTFTVLDSLIGEPCSQIDVSQQTPDKFIAGYRNTFIKENAATPFSLLTQYSNPAVGNFMHADQRGVSFDPFNDNNFYYCNDGGLYRLTNNGTTINSITGNMQLAHLYNFADSDSNPYKILVASLDVYPYIIGSSGISNTFTQYVESFATHMSPLNDSVFCMGMYTPGFTNNNGGTFFNSTHALIGNGFMSSNGFQYDDCNENVCYFSSYNDIFKSSDFGVHFGNLAQTTYNPVNSFIGHPRGFIVSRANPRYVYVYYTDSVYVTSGANGSFVNISGGLPMGQAAVSCMVVDPANENNAWIGFSGYSSGNKIFFTNNAGQTWTNISNGLPNIPINVLVCQNGIPGGVYAATDGGVFYFDNTFLSWQFYNTGLPNVMITDLEINYGTEKLRAATFGRGVWETDLFQPTPAGYILPPVALFTAPVTHACPNEIVAFVNESCGVVDSLLWDFPGAIPSTSTQNNPAVTYATPGNYSVTMIAFNSGGSDTLVLSNYIEITSTTALPYYEPVVNLNQSILPSGCYATEVNFDGATWNRGWWTDGSSGTDDDFLYYDNFFHDLEGDEERLVFPVFDLAGTTAPKLFFYRSYQQRNWVDFDTLVIYVKPCGSNETIVYTKGGPQLANIPGYYDFFYWIPSLPTHWVRDSVDLTSFAGQSVTISFGDIGHGGQMLYIDEFRVMETFITGTEEIASPTSIVMFPNPVTNILYIRSENAVHSPANIYDVTGRKLYTLEQASLNFSIDLSTLAPGLYFLELNGVVKRFEKLKE